MPTSHFATRLNHLEVLGLGLVAHLYDPLQSPVLNDRKVKRGTARQPALNEPSRKRKLARLNRFASRSPNCGVHAKTPAISVANG